MGSEVGVGDGEPGGLTVAFEVEHHIGTQGSKKRGIVGIDSGEDGELVFTGKSGQVAGGGEESIAGQRHGRIGGGLETIDDEKGQVVHVSESGRDRADVEVVSVIDEQGGAAGGLEGRAYTGGRVQGSRTQTLIINPCMSGRDTAGNIGGTGPRSGIQDGTATDNGRIPGRTDSQETTAHAGGRSDERKAARQKTTGGLVHGRQTIGQRRATSGGQRVQSSGRHGQRAGPPHRARRPPTHPS